MFKSPVWVLLAPFFLIFLLGPPAFCAETTRIIAGTVEDARGAVVSGVVLTVTNKWT
jgi:hypothetical protein